MPVFFRSTANRFASLGARGALALAASTVAWSAAPAAAQQQPPAAEVAQPDIENAKHQMDGVLLRPEFVRAGPGESFYATAKLEKGARVVVVGSKSNWLKIVPPAGSFSYVQKVSVQRFGDGKQGKATGTQLIVKAGSSIQPLMWYPQCRLQPKETVDIVGEDELFYRIKPPAAAYLYIARESVEAHSPTADAVPAGAGLPPAVPAAPPAAPPSAAPPTIAPPSVAPRPLAPQPPTGSRPLVPPTPGDSAAGTVRPATGPAAEPARAEVPATRRPDAPSAAPNVDPSGKPMTAAEAVQLLQELEPQFVEASKKPLPEQPLADLVAAYEQVAATPGVNDVTRRWVENRLAALKVRTDARAQLQAAEQQQRVGQQRLVAQRAEGQEIASQMKQKEMVLFAVVGTLRASSVQVSKTPLYRVTDPETGRTLAYVWATDAKVAGLVDKFVGLRGPIQTHPRLNLKVVNPTVVEALDPAKLNVAYAADVTPPSLQPKAPTASAE